jgi:hypothetical protein
MWIFTPDGILMPSLVPEEFVRDGLELAVRSRRRRDLEKFRERYMIDAPMSPIYEIAGTDYDFRFDTTREAFANAAAALMRDIDYIKFKPETENAKKGRHDRELHLVYNRIWHIVAPLGMPYGRPYRRSFGEKVWLWQENTERAFRRLRSKLSRG